MVLLTGSESNTSGFASDKNKDAKSDRRASRILFELLFMLCDSPSEQLVHSLDSSFLCS